MKNTYLKTLAILLAAALCFFMPFTHSKNTVSPANLSAIQANFKPILRTKPAPASNEDFLLAILGTDERASETSRSDVIILLKYKAKENKAIIVSIPRDSKVWIPDKGEAKLNAGYAYGGAKLQVKLLEDLFKVNNIKYIHMNFSGFVEIVNTIGGLEIRSEKDFIREWGKKDIYVKKGNNVLLGDDLLEYVRFRNDREGDYGRIKRQQQVLQCFVSSIMNPKNIAKLPNTALLIAKHSDSDIDIFTMMKHLSEFKRYNTLEFEYLILKTTSKKENGIWYEIIDKKSLKLISDLLQT